MILYTIHSLYEDTLLSTLLPPLYLVCMSDTSEILPYVIGTLITIALIKWLFSKVEDRPIHSPSLYFSYTPDPESVSQLQGMFPTIPRAYIVRELDRCDGNVAVAVDKLVLLAPDFMRFRGEETVNGIDGQVDTSPAITCALSTHHNLLNSLNNSAGSDTIEFDSTSLNKRNWDKVDAETRQRILTERKREMLVKARESFCCKRESSE